MTTPRLGLQELIAAMSQPEVPVNKSFRILDQLVQLSVLDVINSPPGSPADGDVYIVDSVPTGVFVGHSKSIAFFVAGDFNQWRFIPPKPGFIALNAATNKFLSYSTAAAWVSLSTMIGP